MFRTNLVIALLLPVAQAQVLQMPSGWIETKGPSGSSEKNSELRCANYSPHEWQAAIASGHLQLTDRGVAEPENVIFPPRFVRTKDMPGRAMVLQVGDGWLIGFNAGEFGGGLWWSTSDGSHTKPLSSENVQALVRRGEDVLVLTGLAHLGIDWGAAYKFRQAAGENEFVRIADLGSAPADATLQRDGSILIVVSNGVLILRPDGRLTRLYRHDEMPFLYPNSVVGDESDVIYVGMRFYALRLQRRPDNSFQPTWFQRSECARTKFKDYQCICTGKVGAK